METLSEEERSGFNPFLSIYIEFPFYLIAHANGILYHMPGTGGGAENREKFSPVRLRMFTSRSRMKDIKDANGAISASKENA